MERKKSEDKKDKNEDKIDISKAKEEKIIEEDENIGKSEKMKFYSFKNFEINNLLNFPYNIFFSIILTDIQAKTAKIATYVDENFLFSSIYNNYKPNLITKSMYDNDKGGHNYFFVIS